MIDFTQYTYQYILARAGREAWVLTRKAVVPDADEIERNPRSRSAKLRIAELERS